MEKDTMTHAKQWIGLTLLCSLLLFAGTQALAQQPKIAHATIPFQFWIGDNPLPAGSYEIEHFVSSTLVLFRSKDGSKVQQADMIPLDQTAVSLDQAKLVFVVQNGRHYLYAFWGLYGKRVMTAESAQPVPAKDRQLEVPVVYR
jgi:hypothetical protein